MDGCAEDPDAMDAMRWANETSRAESSEKALKLGRNFRKKKAGTFLGTVSGERLKN